jgi:membrane fusion protein, multidrug efflux system
VSTPHLRRLAVALLAFAVACSGGEEGGHSNGDGKNAPGEEGAEGPTAPGPERRVLVDAAAVSVGSVADHLVTSGVLESEAQADITPEATGTIIRIAVQEGDPVRRGQTLAWLENPSLDAGAERANLELERATQVAAEAGRLHAGGAMSDMELRDANNALLLAQANAREAKESAGFTRIDSPIAGTVAVRDVRVGEAANAGQRAFQVVDLDRLRVIVQLPEGDLPRIRVGQTAVLTGAYDEDAQSTGTVQRISPVVDPGTGTVRTTIAVEPGQTALRPGQFTKVRIEVDRHNDVMVIPRRALIYQDGEPIAWKVVDGIPEAATTPEESEEAEEEEGGFFADLFGGDDEAGDDAEDGEGEEEDAGDPWEGIPLRVAEKARLELGFADTDFVEIKKGLAEGELVVTIGNGTLREESLLRLPEDPEKALETDDSEDEEAASGDDASGDDASAG